MDDPRPANTTVPVARSAIGGRLAFHRDEMGSRWRASRAVAQIHALVYLDGRPLHTEEITASLQMAHLHDSTSRRDRVHWNLVSVLRAMGDQQRVLVPQPKRPLGRA